jgi:xanthine dehydrogenase accessory factor
MKEIRDIVQAYDRATMQNQRTAMATVVKVDGSSYRRPGARMLVTEDCMITGAISGGCLEGDALQKAQFAIFSGENKFAIYDSTNEDDIQFGLHLGCNEVVYVLFEPIKKEDPNNPVELLRRIYDTGEDAVIVTIFSQRSVSPLGTRLLYLTKNFYSIDEDLQRMFSDPVKMVYNNASAGSH